MDEFRAWWNRSPINENYKTEGHRLAAKKAWQESRKQAVAEAALRDRHTRESHEEKGALVERERIVGWLRAWAIGLSVIDVKTSKCTFSTKGKILLEVADRIEKD